MIADRYIYRGALLYHAMDFEGVLRNCGPVAAHPSEHHRTPATENLPLKYRIALIFCGLAEAGLGCNAAALGHLRAAKAEMERQPANPDSYWRLALEWGMLNVLIAHGDHPAALSRAKRLCDLPVQTDERTWQALAWEAHARAALSCGEAEKAGGHVEKALAACEGGRYRLRNGGCTRPAPSHSKPWAIIVGPGRTRASERPQESASPRVCRKAAQSV
jgi:hypothetical protein